MTEATDTLSLAEAEESIRVAVALGYPAPTFLGATVWQTDVTMRDSSQDYPCNCGTYQTREAAETAIRNWVISQWYESGTHPLFQIDLEGDTSSPLSDIVNYAAFSNAEILATYFDFYTRDTYTIAECRISPAPTPAS